MKAGISTLEKQTAVRDGLMRLLAEENLLVIRHDKPSAFFDLKERSVHVPNWDFDKLDASNAGTVMDVHEVLHALYTPDTHTVNATRNILEDIRIERLGKLKFPGIKQIFTAGYRELHETLNFFKLRNARMTEINSLNFIDRLNVYAKIGFALPLPIEFSNEEMVFVRRAFETSSFEDILKLEIDIKKFLKDQGKEDQAITLPQSSKEDDDNATPTDDDENQLSDTDDQEGDGEESDEREDKKNHYSPDASNGSEESDKVEESESESETNADSKEISDDLPEPESKTINAFDEALNKILSTAVPEQLFVGSISQEYHKNVPIKTVRDILNITMDDVTLYSGEMHYNETSSKFHNTAKRSAMVLYKEFQQRKNARERVFDTVKNTGKIDTKRIHLSAFTDNIFKQKTTIFKGKNHGFVFLLDVSGSMQGDRILATYNQLLTVVEFCRKANIKYKVYTYTNSTHRPESTFNEFDSGNVKIYGDFDNREKGTVITAGLTEIMCSSLNSREHSEVAKLLYGFFSGYARPIMRKSFALYAGTNTCQAVMQLEKHAKAFFDLNKIEKRNIVLLTDGSSSDKFHKKEIYQPGRIIPDKTIITDLKTKRIHVSSNYRDGSQYALRMIGDRINAKIMVMQLASSIPDAYQTSDILRQYIGSYTKYAYFVDANKKKFSQQKFISFKHNIVDSVYIIKMVETESTNIKTILAGDLKEKSAKQIASALISANKAEKTSRVLMESLATAFS